MRYAIDCADGARGERMRAFQLSFAFFVQYDGLRHSAAFDGSTNEVARALCFEAPLSICAATSFFLFFFTRRLRAMLRCARSAAADVLFFFFSRQAFCSREARHAMPPYGA